MLTSTTLIANAFILDLDMTPTDLRNELMNFNYDLIHMIDLIIDYTRFDEVCTDDDKNLFELYEELPSFKQDLVYSHIITHLMYILITNSAN